MDICIFEIHSTHIDLRSFLILSCWHLLDLCFDKVQGLEQEGGTGPAQRSGQEGLDHRAGTKNMTAIFTPAALMYATTN